MILDPSLDIVLIGPYKTGKSSVSKLLAHELALPRVSLDELRWKYYSEIGYDKKVAQDYRSHSGDLALILYWNLFAAHSVERILSDHQDCVFDFGAGIYESRESFARVRQALRPYRNVILLLPSPDMRESLQILSARKNMPADHNFDFNRHFLTHRTYYELAKTHVYTKGKSPEETCREILDLGLV